MSAKIIKLTDNNNVTLIPVTDASVVQMSVDGQVKSVKDVILENEEVTAAGYNELDDRVEVLENAGYITSANIPSLSRTGSNKTVTLNDSKFTYISNINVSNHSITYDYVTATIPTPTDEKVKYVGKSSGEYPILFSSSTSPSDNSTSTVSFDTSNGAKYNTSTNTLYSENINGENEIRCRGSYMGLESASGTSYVVSDIFTGIYNYPENSPRNELSPGETHRVDEDIAEILTRIGDSLDPTIGASLTMEAPSSGSTHETWPTSKAVYSAISKYDPNLSYYTCSTAAGTAAKTVTKPDGHEPFTLTKDAIVHVYFTVTNTAGTPTLNIDGTGAKNIYLSNANIGTKLVKGYYTLQYDGSRYNVLTVPVNTSNIGATASGVTAKYDKTTSGTIGSKSLSGTLASFTVSGSTGAKNITIPALNISGNVSNLTKYKKYNAIDVTINDTTLGLAGGNDAQLQYSYTLAAQSISVGGQSFSSTVPEKTVTIPNHDHTFIPTHTSTTLSNITQPTITITIKAEA